MAIKYNKLFALLESKGLTPYSLRREKIIGNATLEKLQKGQGNIDTRSLDRLCKYLQCQPGDLMEYTDTAETEIAE
jgi:putative transcriptional regulator